MTLTEYKESIRVLREALDKAEHQLAKAYADANFSVAKGSIVTDNLGRIRVSSSGCYFDHGEPKKLFKGVMVTRKGEDYKSGEHRVVYQCNIREVGAA